MKSPTLTLAGALALMAIVGATTSRSTQATEKKTMELGNFSVSLTVKDIKASKAFYEKLDFKEVGGKLEQNWIVLQNGNARIGLFQGMFNKNMMTFNPRWAKDKETLKDFLDVRELQRTLKARGLTLAAEADETSEGPRTSWSPTPMAIRSCSISMFRVRSASGTRPDTGWRLRRNSPWANSESARCDSRVAR